MKGKVSEPAGTGAFHHVISESELLRELRNHFWMGLLAGVVYGLAGGIVFSTLVFALFFEKGHP